MDNPKLVNRFLLGCLASVLAFALGLSIYAKDFSILFSMTGLIVLILIGCAVVSLSYAVMFGPLLWLFSWLSSRRSKRKP